MNLETKDKFIIFIHIQKTGGITIQRILSQAQALVRQGIDLQVVSFTSWVPQAMALVFDAKVYANCPKEYT